MCPLEEEERVGTERREGWGGGGGRDMKDESCWGSC